MRINLATDPRDKWVEFLKGWMVTTRLLRELLQGIRLPQSKIGVIKMLWSR